MWDIFELIAGVFEVLGRWRILLCLLAGLALLVGVFDFVPDEPLRTVAAVVVVIAALAYGIESDLQQR